MNNVWIIGTKCWYWPYFSLTAALKGNGLQESLKELGKDDGIGSKGELSKEEAYSFNDYGEDPDCQQIEDDVRRANQTMESALPGNLTHNKITEITKSIM